MLPTQGMETFLPQSPGLLTGKHPCALCCVVQDGRKHEERKAPGLQSELKKDFIIRSFLFEVVRDFIWRDYVQYGRELVGITLEPLIPPPRIR